MANTQLRQLESQIKGMEKKIRQIILVTLTQYANRIVSEAVAMVNTTLVNPRTSYSIEIDEQNLRVDIVNNNDMIAYIEFGTGHPGTVKKGLSAETYLAGQPQEVKDAAIEFFVTGEGTIPARPHLFPTFYKYRDQIIPEIERRIQKYLKAA